MDRFVAERNSWNPLVAQEQHVHHEKIQILDIFRCLVEGSAWSPGALEKYVGTVSLPFFGVQLCLGPSSPFVWKVLYNGYDGYIIVIFV